MPSLVAQEVTADDTEDDSSTQMIPSKSTPSKSAKRANTSGKRRSSIIPPTSKPSLAEKTKKATKINSMKVNQKSIAAFFSTASTRSRTPSQAAPQPTATNSMASLDAKEALRDIVLGVCSNGRNKESTKNLARRKNLPLPTICYPSVCTKALEEATDDDDDDATIEHVEVSDEEVCLTMPLDAPIIKVSLPITEDAPQVVIASEQTTISNTTAPDIQQDGLVINPVFITPQTVKKKVTNKRKNMNSSESTPSKDTLEITLEIPKAINDTQETNAIPLSPERTALLAKNNHLRQKYLQQSTALIQQGIKGVAEEAFQIPKAELPPVMESNNGAFPEGALAMLASLVQESQRPLSDLAIAALEQLQKAFPKLSLDCVTEKIKVLATRESYVVSLPGQLTQTKTNVFEDNDTTRMWRWEVIILELLPDTVTLQIKRARAARRKLRHHAKSIGKLLASLNAADKLFSDANSTKEKCDAFVTRISNEQEKILKFERETEKARLLEDAKKKNGESIMVEKNFTQNVKVVEKHVVKGSQLEQKRKEKEILEAERLKKKEEMAHLKEGMKLKKQNEREEKEAKAKLEKEQAITKNKTRLLSFFSSGLAETPSTTLLKENSTSAKATSLLTEKERSNFWSLINSSDVDFRTKPLFASLSKSAIQSRTRRTLKVSVDVYVTVMPDDPFSAQPYADLQSIQVPNKYKFLSFEEDHRPAYHGTWSKESSIVTGPTPFGKDTQFLDYDVDSEEEWEEGDDEIGEDLEANDNDDEEENVDPDEGDTRAYNFHDGWLADDDDVIYEDGEADEDAKRLRRAVLKRSESKLEQSELCVICPIYGGLPLSDHKQNLESVEGVIDAGTAFRLEMLNTKEEIELDEDLCFLDTAFPPELSEEASDLADYSATPTMTKVVSAPPEMSEEEIKVFARFVHHSKLPSKDQLVEQLRIAHPTITSSRAQATRKLHAIATKHRSPAGVFVWLVKDDVLTELNLVDLLKMKLEEPTSNETKTTKPKTTKGNVVGPDNIVTSIAPHVLDTMDTNQSETNNAHQLKVLKESIGATKKRKAPKPSESNRVKRAKIDGQKEEATKCKNASSLASKIMETPSSREIKRKTPSAGSARLFAAFLVGKKPKVANASGNTNS